MFEASSQEHVHTTPVVSLKEVSVHYGDNTALNGVSLDFYAGQYSCIVGENGSGKSTLANVISALIAPDEGRVCLADRCVFDFRRANFSAYAQAQRSVGLVFQNPDDQIITNIVRDDIAFGPENLGLDEAEIEQRVAREIERCALKELAEFNPSQLSGGQKQRVAIAGVLAMSPSIIVFDEPGAQLDVRGKRAILRVMKRLTQRGACVIHITHFMEEVPFADRVVVMHKGSVAQDTTPQKLFQNEALLCSYGLQAPFSVQLIRSCIARNLLAPSALAELLHSISHLTQKDVCADLSMHAHPIDAYDRACAEAIARLLHSRTTTPSARTSQDIARCNTPTGHAQVAAQSHKDARSPLGYIELSHVGFHYSSRRQAALKDVSLSIAQGEHIALIGQTGSGKSTLLRLLSKLEQPDEGEIRILDNLSLHTPIATNTQNKKTTGQARFFRRFFTRKKSSVQHKTLRIGYIMQYPERQLFAPSVLDDVMFAPKNQGMDEESARKEAVCALECVGLLDKQDASPFDLSRGEQRRCAIAGVLAMRPDILLVDEITSGIDPITKRHIQKLLATLEHTITLIEVTHSMNEAARADRVVVLNEGTICAQGTPAEIFAPACAQKLEEIGLGLPFACEMTRMLEDRGICLCATPHNLNQLMEVIEAYAEHYPHSTEQHPTASKNLSSQHEGRSCL